MMKRTAIAVIVFASQATLAIAQSTNPMDRGVVSPEDSGYLGGWVQRDPAPAGTAATPRGSMASPIALGHRFVSPEDSGYLGGWGQDDRTSAGTAAASRAPVISPIDARRNFVGPEDSGFLGRGA